MSTAVTNPSTAPISMLQKRDSALGQPLPRAMGIEALQPLVEEALAGHSSSTEFELVDRRPPLRIMAHATPQRRGDGAVVVMHDITEARRLENVRRDFIANASHELRTPVSIIQANTETLLDGAMDDSEVGRGLLEALERNAERLGSLISDLLDLSQLDAGHYALELAPVTLAETATSVLESLEQAILKKRIRVVNEVNSSAQVVADGSALEQVLLNLLHNAVKYTPDGGLVILRDRELDTGMCIEVEDDGPGVPPEHRAHLFERFYRADPGRSRDMGGTGLGLAIVKSLVEAMGGRVGMRPGPRRGAVFWVVLPWKPDVLEPERVAG